MVRKYEGEKIEMTESFFDYELPHTCQYSVPFAGREVDCGDPAPFRGIWVDEVGHETSEMWLCKKHLQAIVMMEKKYG